MPKVTYIEFNGNIKEADIEAGTSLMQGALDNAVEGILAECGGSCACATCHCYLENDWIDKAPPAEDLETMLVESAPGANANSRLSCQLIITDDLDGLTVRIPESQY